jgi:predicted anti-sigma-YlaC factor YlaD
VRGFNSGNALKPTGSKMIHKLIELLPIIPCKKATRLMSEALERRLTLKESVELKLHLSVCDLCERFLKQIQSLRKLLRAYTPQSEQHLPPDVKSQIKKTLQRHPESQA